VGSAIEDRQPYDAVLKIFYHTSPGNGRTKDEDRFYRDRELFSRLAGRIISSAIDWQKRWKTPVFL
jgi:hypothetical protein